MEKKVISGLNKDKINEEKIISTINEINNVEDENSKSTLKNENSELERNKETEIMRKIIWK